MDNGIFPGNYHDYGDDEVAIQREFEIADNLEDHFRDEDFPANARSLYFDPLNPPKGAIPNESVKWFSISQGDVSDCTFPEFFKADNFSCLMEQGALGDSYFINALRLLTCQPKYIRRLLVSEKFSTQGLYTFKFCKAGKWRYIHIDDRIPCRQSGRVNYCRNLQPNETFAMLLEKAYAKLHGCYEAISCGMIDKVLQDLTASAAVQCYRMERFRPASVCNEIWDILERGISDHQLMGCGRFISDPYGENPVKRKGITLGCLYQVMDVVISTAEPTEDLDAITVGMVCLRNLQHNAGRYTGRWSYGHKIWAQYKEIAVDLRHRTREIQHKRGLGANPNDSSEAQVDDRGEKLKLFADDTDDTDPDDENDDLDPIAYEKRQAVKMIQPQADDLHWVQIEDFVEVFNRLFVACDLTFQKEGAVKRYVSKWLPGDFIGGSGGPPIIITAQTEAVDSTGDGGGNSNDKDGNATGDQEDKNTNKNSEEKQEKQEPKIIERYAMINDNFTDNPMYPFSVTEPTTLNICLYQKDRRWNIGRLGDNPRDVITKSFSSRSERLQACMEYSIGISFLIVRLNGLKHRLTEFKLKKIVAGSENMVFSNVTNNIVSLRPGRYAIIPYTHTMLSRAVEYVLHCSYLSHQVEFEIEDVLAQRLVDDAPSDEDEDEELQPDDNDLLHLHDDSDDVSIMSYEKVKVVHDGDGFDEEEEEEDDESSLEGHQARVRAPVEKAPPPRILLYKPWEYVESTEELGVAQVFSEVGDVMRYVKTLRGEVRKLNATVRALQASERAARSDAYTAPAGTTTGTAGAGGVEASSIPFSTVPTSPTAAVKSDIAAGFPSDSPQKPSEPPTIINPNKRR